MWRTHYAYDFACREIGEWKTEHYPFFGEMEEVKRVDITRGANMMEVASARWVRGKKDSHIVLIHFPDETYFLGKIEFMFTCVNRRTNAERGLFAYLDLREVEGVCMDYFDDDGAHHLHSLNNLCRYKAPANRDKYICPVWDISNKCMKCVDTKHITYFCGY